MTALAQAGPGTVVNVVGPIGIGKSRLLSGLTPVDGKLAVADHADSAEAVSANTVPSGAIRRCFVVGSRRPLSSWPEWLGTPVRTVTLPPWHPEEIWRLAGELGVTDPVQQRVVSDLSGGIPLIAERLCQAGCIRWHVSVKATRICWASIPTSRPSSV